MRTSVVSTSVKQTISLTSSSAENPPFSNETTHCQIVTHNDNNADYANLSKSTFNSPVSPLDGALLIPIMFEAKSSSQSALMQNMYMLYESTMQHTLEYLTFRETLELRFVSSGWRAMTNKHIENWVNQKAISFQRLKELNIQTTIALPIEAQDEVASHNTNVVKHVDLSSCLKQCDFHELTIIQKYNHPPGSIVYGMLSCLHILASNEQLQELEQHNWDFFKTWSALVELICKDQASLIGKIDKMSRLEITQERVMGFNESVQKHHLHIMRLTKCHRALSMILSWCKYYIDHANFFDTLSPEVQSHIKSCEKERFMQIELEKLNTYIKLT
jgi:hypothetical protein